MFPLQFGGGQERGLRPGTENVAVAAGLGCAAQLVTSNLEKISAHLQSTREKLELALKVSLNHCNSYLSATNNN